LIRRDARIPAAFEPARTTSTGVLLGALVAAVLLGGCTVSGGGSATSRVPTPSGPAVNGSLGPAVLDPILADASARTGAPKESIEIVTAEARTWPDGSLGCPQPGMAYTQVVTDGYRVLLRAAGRTLDYRGSGRGAFRLCEPAKPAVSPVPSPSE
jgi:hypothetical protein